MPRLDLEVDDELRKEEKAGGCAGEEGDDTACEGTFADPIDWFGKGVEGTEGCHGRSGREQGEWGVGVGSRG